MTPTPKRRWLRRILVAVVALVAVATIYLWRRADSMRQRSEEHLMKAAMFWEVVNGIDRLPTRTPQQEALRSQFQAQLDYHANLSQQYEQAIWRPWLAPAEADPPP